MGGRTAKLWIGAVHRVEREAWQQHERNTAQILSYCLTPVEQGQSTAVLVRITSMLPDLSDHVAPLLAQCILQSIGALAMAMFTVYNT